MPYEPGSERTLPHNLSTLLTPDPKVNYDRLIRAARQWGLPEVSGGVITPDSIWTMHLGPLTVLNGGTLPTRFSSVGIAVNFVEAGPDSKPRGQNALVVMKEKPDEPMTEKEFKTDIEQLSNDYLPKHVSAEDRYGRRVTTGLPIAGALIGAGAGFLTDEQPIWLSMAFGGGGGTFAGAAAVSGLTLINFRSMPNFSPRFDGYLADAQAAKEIAKLEKHMAVTAISRELRRDIKGIGIDLDWPEFNQVYDDLGYKTGWVLQDKRWQEMEQASLPDDEEKVPIDAIERMSVIVSSMREKERQNEESDRRISRATWAREPRKHTGSKLFRIRVKQPVHSENANNLQA